MRQECSFVGLGCLVTAILTPFDIDFDHDTTRNHSYRPVDVLSRRHQPPFSPLDFTSARCQPRLAWSMSVKNTGAPMR